MPLESEKVGIKPRQTDSQIYALNHHRRMSIPGTALSCQRWELGSCHTGGYALTIEYSDRESNFLPRKILVSHKRLVLKKKKKKQWAENAYITKETEPDIWTEFMLIREKKQNEPSSCYFFQIWNRKDKYMDLLQYFPGNFFTLVLKHMKAVQEMDTSFLSSFWWKQWLHGTKSLHQELYHSRSI